jgi:branched-chain amino acid transport system permease protein
MNLSNFVNSFWSLTIGGIVLGSIYALVALGYTLVYGVLRLINFANSEVFMLGCFGSFIALKVLGVEGASGGGGDPYKTGFALVATLAFCLVFSVAFSGAAAVIIERVAYRPLRRRNAPRLVFLISAIGVSYAISEAVGEWGAKSRDEYAIPRVLEKRVLFHFFDAQVRIDYVITVIGALIMMAMLMLFVNRTRIGRGIRAVAQDAESARIMGVDVDRVIVITFLVGGVMAGAAAWLFEIYNGYARYNVGFQVGVKAFIAAVLGGIGNIRGALLGGLLLGVLENYGSNQFGGQQMGTVSAFVILVLVLMFRPSGILGESLGRARA